MLWVSVNLGQKKLGTEILLLIYSPTLVLGPDKSVGLDIFFHFQNF